MRNTFSALRLAPIFFVGLLIFIQPAIGLLLAGAHISTPSDLGSVSTGVAIEPILLQAVGGTQPYSWSLVTGGTAGVLPPGLALGADGRITGTPTIAQTAKTFTVRVTDAGNATVQKAFTIAVGADSPRVSSAAMGGARVGEVYLHTFQVLQGKPPYAWSTNSTLPAGLSLDSTSGVISGTPDASTVNATASFRDYPIALRLTASGNATTTANFTLTVAKAIEWVTPPNLPVQFVGPNCSVSLLVSGGKPAYSFSVQSGSALPPGMVLGNSTGILSGKPSAVGNYSFTIAARDAVGSSISRTFAIQLIPYTLAISGPASGNGTQYSTAMPLQFSAIGGAEPYKYSSTNLPPGLSINASTGLVTGSLNGTAGTSNFTVTVTDNKGMTANATCAFTLSAGPVLKWTVDPLQSGKVLQAYSANLSAASGGWAPYTYSVNASTLPAGLTFNPATRRLSGNATAGGNFSVVLTVRDSATPPNVVNATLANSASPSIPLYIEPYSMSINGTTSLSVAQYAALSPSLFTVVGGAAPYTWSTTTTPPATLKLTTTGANGTAATLAGNATAAPGNYTIGVKVTDKTGQSVTLNVTLAITPLQITWGTQPLLPSGKVGSPYTTNLTISGGRPAYTYALKNGSVLPAGLTLNATTGIISGTPTKESADDTLVGKVILNVSKTGNDSLGNGSSAAPFATIQKAIDSASNGNVVLVGPGTYSGAGNTNLNLRGKQIIVKSSNGPEQTILDLGRQKGVSADSTETLDTIIDGFTFKNGYVQSGADWGGEAIVCTRNQASLKIKNCIFTLNETKATYVTTGMHIIANRSSSASTPQIENCLFYNNTIGGGGWSPYSGGSASVIGGFDVLNSTIANNTLYSSAASWSGYSGGILIAVACNNIKNSIIWGNTASYFPSTYENKYQLGSQSQAALSVSYSISQNGSINNGSTTVLNSAPIFINASVGDFRLGTGSPGIDAGDPASSKDSDGSRADMGYRKTADPLNGFSFTIIARDSATPQNTVEREFTLPVASYGMSVSGPDAATGVQYSSLNATQFTVSGGVAPYRWSATGLPAALSINATTGLVSGNLTATPGNYTANITVTDNRSQTATKNFMVTISTLPMAWSTNATLPAGKVADAYSTNLTVTSGLAPYTYALSNSTLPAGLALNPSNGLLSGTPTAAGNYSFTINASDSAVPKNTISRNFTLTIAPYGMAISGPVSISGQQYNSISSTQFLVSGGAGNYTWSTVPSPAVPAALSINATTGLLSGNLIASPGNYTLGIKVTDKIGQSVTSNLTVTILQGTPLSWVTAANLPNAKVATPYSTTLQSAGGMKDYSYSVKAGSALPPGLKLATYTIQLLIYPPVPGTPNTVIEGTPTTAGTYKFTLVARDSLGNTVDREFTLVVDLYGMSIGENPVISGKRFTSITPVQLAVTGGTANYTWSANSTTGLAINSSTGLLSGNLTAAPGNYTLIASVRDGRNQTATRNLTVSILQVDPITWVTNATLTPGKVAENYSANLTVKDGTPPYNFVLKTGSTLPANFTLNATTGVLRGTPAAPGNFTFTLIAGDSGNATTERAFTLAVAPYGMAITNEPPITGQMNQAFSYPFTVSGGIAAYTWNATGAPTGLSMNASTGVLSGTPTASGNFATSVRVTDGKTQTVSRNYTISIGTSANLSISTPPNLGTIEISKGYTTTLQAVGGKPPYTWMITGTKPASVNLAANGSLTANSSTALTANFTVRVQDSSVPAANATQAMTIVFRDPNQLAIATTSLPQGRASSEYSHQLAATGGKSPYQWVLKTGTLPAGLALSPTGWLTGTANSAANATLTFEVTDSVAAKATRQLQLVIGGQAGNSTASGKLFTDVTSSVNLPEHYIIAVEDFDNDGREDLLANNAEGRLVLMRGVGAFDFLDITANAGLTEALPALVADFNNDGVSDILSVNLQRTEATLFLNNGQGVFTKQPLTSLLTGDLANYRDISFADVDGDGDLDLLFNINAATGGGVVAVFNQSNISQTTSPLLSGKSYLIKTTWKNAKFSVTDANGDGKPDLVVIQTNGVWPTDTHRSNPASLYLNTGNTTADYANPTGAKNLAGFTIKPNSGIVGANEMSAFASLDIDNDGDLDLLNGSSDWPSASVPHIYINDGTGIYTQKDSPILHGSYYHHGATIFDTDLDGDQDAVWTSLHVFKDVYPRLWENGATYLKATANGTVDPAKAFFDSTTTWGVDAKISGSGNMGSAGYAADLDGDGDLDFVTNLWSNTTTFKVYRNDANLRQANWLKVELIGAVSPAQGTGARVEVELKDARANKPAQAIGASRYEIVTGNFTWTQAKADAEAKGGHLATITSADEWQIIQQRLGSSLSGKNLWLGATDVDQEGVWKWITGEPWGYARWLTSQPDNYPSPSGPEDFLHIFGYEDSLLRWNDLPNNPVGDGFHAGSRGKLDYLLEVQIPTATTKLAQYLGYDSGAVTLGSLTFGLADKTQAAKVTVYWPSGLKSVLENVDGNRVIQIREADELPLPRPTDEGDVIAWGANPNGETTVPTNLGKAVQIAAGDSSSAALRTDGTVSAWGTNWAGQLNIPAGLKDVVQIAAGNHHYLALTSNGSVLAWGWNTVNQTAVPATIRRAKLIAAGFNSSYALLGDGRIIAWGGNDVGQLNVPAALSGVTALSAGRGHVLALKSNGTVVAWGRNDLGQATVPAGLSNVIQIATGDYHSLALKSDGTVVAWGANWIKQSTIPAGLTNVVQISAKGDRSLALKADNSVVSWGLNADTIAPPPAPGKMLNISGGSKHSLGLVRKIQIALTGDLPVLKENQPLSDFGFTATGGSGNYTWSVVGTKPDWLTLNATTGLLSGTPTTAGNQTITIRASSGGRWSDISLTFEIQKADPTALWVATTGNNTTGDGSLGKPFATITKAHSVANRGDVIKVQPGNYTESVVIEKAVEISSTAGPAQTTIRSAGLASAVYGKGSGIHGGKLIGFTITGGGGANNPGYNRYGGGLAIDAPAGTTYEVVNCIIRNNTDAGITFGGGFHVTGGSTLKLTNSLVHSNAAWANGGAALIEGANLIADRCTIVSNTNNGFNRIGGISAAGNCNIQIKNSILWSNTTNQYGSFSSGPAGNATFTFSYSDIQGGTTATVGGNTKTIVVVGPGNINSDPKFAETTYYTLGTGSPAINTGNPVAKDVDGTRADIGWDSAAAAKGSSNADSDGDGVNDYREIYDGTNPFDLRDFDPLSLGLIAHFDGESLKDQAGVDGLLLTTKGDSSIGIGKKSQGFILDGINDGFQLSDVPSLKLKSFSIGAWIKWSGPTGNPQMAIFRGGYDGGNDPFTLGIQDNGGVFTQINHGVFPTSTLQSQSGLVFPNIWVYLIATYDLNSKNHKLYLNGNLIAQGSCDGSMITNLPEWAEPGWSIGNHSGYQYNYPFNGFIDETRFYNRSLSAAEVSQLYSKESGQSNIVLVQGGALPAGSGFANQTVSAFQLSRFETTWAEWKTVRTWAAANGYDIGTVGQGSADNHPVQRASWYDIVKWLNAKSEMEGLTPVYSVNGQVYRKLEYGEFGSNVVTMNPTANGYRLPMEAEWEFAARGGSLSQGYIYAGSNNVNEVAVYRENSTNPITVIFDDRGTWPIGTKKPNELGLYDMSGNLYEFCWDQAGNFRRARSGSWLRDASCSAINYRNSLAPHDRNGDYGFRIARNAVGDMVTVQGGTLPAGSGLAGQSVQAFQIGRTEVTWGEWKSVRDWAVLNGYSDLIYSGSGGGDVNPVQNINWQTIVKWCNAKSEKEGFSPVYYVNGAVCRSGTPQLSVSNVLQISESADGYRIPSMKEWFWAHEGGLLSQNYTFSGSNSLDSVAWTGSNSYNSQSSYLDGNGRGTWPAGLKQPNELGIFDMTGNVSEWSWNAAGPYFCLGGGCYWDQQNFSVYSAPTSNSGAGLRLARNIGPKISISGTMPEPTLNQAYAGYTFTAVGATSAPVWSLSSGSLPPGMSFNATTATLSGTPTTAGNYTFTIKVASGGYWDEMEVRFPIFATSAIWGSGEGNWSFGFSPTISNSSNATYTGAQGGNSTNDIASATLGSIGSLTFDSTAGAFTLAATSGAAGFNATSALQLNGDIINNSAATQTINFTLTSNATRVYNAASGNLAMGGAVNGAGGLTKNGTGTLTLSGNNTYTGATTITAGTLLINNSGLIDGTSSIVNNGALIFSKNTTFTIKPITGSGNLTANATLGFIRLGGNITQNGSIRIASSNNYGGHGISQSGPTTIKAASINITGSFGSNSHTSNHVLTLDTSAANGDIHLDVYNGLPGHTYPGVSSVVANAGAGNVTIAGTQAAKGRSWAANLTGAINISSNYSPGVLTLNATASSSISGNLSLASNSTNTWNVNPGVAMSVTGKLAGSNASITKLGTGILALSGNNAYTGATSVNLGTLSVTGNIASSATTVGRGGTLMGTGMVGAVTLNSGGLLGAGTGAAAAGKLSGSTLTISGSSGYVFTIANVSGSGGTAGADYDQIALSGALTLNNTATDKFTLFLSGEAGGWSADSCYNWDFLTAASQTGFSAGNFTTDFANFGVASNLRTGNWSISNPIGGTLRLTYTAAPTITSAASANGTVGTAFSYQITATNNATDYGASGLPAGLSLDATSGLISGTPNAAGNFTVNLTATNAGGTKNVTMSLVVFPAPIVTVTTLAGSGIAGYTNGNGPSASFNNAYGVAADDKGNFYVADTGNHRIRKIDIRGNVTTLAGSGTAGFANGVGALASFNNPTGVAVDGVGNVYVADSGNNRIRKIDAAGNVTTLAGSGSPGLANGLGTSASFNNPFALAIDVIGNVYVADHNNHLIRRIDTGGNVTTLAGSGSEGSADGLGTFASFAMPRGVAVDAGGNVYVGDWGNQLVRKIDAFGNVTTLAGSGAFGFANGHGTSAIFARPNGVAVDETGNVYVSDHNNHRIRKIDVGGNVSTLAGTGNWAFADGSGTSASFGGPIGIAVDRSGNVYVADYYNHRIRKITIGPKISITGTIPDATLNQAYTGYTFNSMGTNAPVTWSTNGTLPPGMSFNATTATLSGTPTTTGAYAFVVRLDSGGYSDEVEVVLQVSSMILVQGGILPAGSALANQTVSAFHINRFETTRSEWTAVVNWAQKNGYDLGLQKTDFLSHPIQNVRWYDAIKWCNAKSEMEGLAPVYLSSGNVYRAGMIIPEVHFSANGYRLPNEIEWEWAARGGQFGGNFTYSGSNTIDDVGWYNLNAINPEFLFFPAYTTGIRPVGLKLPNQLGLYDMSGNVGEWCWESVGSNRRVRGGWFNSPADKCLVSWRGDWYPDGSHSLENIGFRYARNAIGDMVTVQGGILPQSSQLSGVEVSTFLIGRFEVTLNEWQEVRTWALENGYSDLANSGVGSAENHPVRDVSWYDVVKWINAKSEKEGLTPVYQVSGAIYKTGQNSPTVSSAANGYRLPTEAEWEWAARGGVSSQGYNYSGGNDANSVAWHQGNSNGAAVDMGSGRGTWPVGTKLANEISVYDMSGNVWEWVWDLSNQQGSNRRIRGGSWDTDLGSVAYGLTNYNPLYRLSVIGFRLVRNAAP